jgi:class 3 adenylate cyclase/tetratricopeptide (TPR) repeat protein
VTTPTTERKVATMLFADLVGFTSLNESADPELVQALVTRAFDRLSAEVARYEGLVEKFAGDAMLAVFGVPAVHEDDAERAVRAALEMQSAMAALAAQLRDEQRPELSLRIGIETGEVLVDLGRAGTERDRMVTGDPVNTAARLQSVAHPGQIVVGPNTYAATRELVDYEELPPTPLKGKALPVAAWRTIRVRSRRGGLRPALGMEAPLIGRDEELALLKETVRRTVADGRPHLVTAIGSAGVGKSRLTWELEKYLDGLPDAYHWRKGRCLAYAQASFSALADAIKSDARILDDDAPATALAKLDARLAELGAAGDPTLAPAVRTLLAIGPTPDLAREDLFDAWRRYLSLIARIDPLVLVQEDIHWADDGLLDFIESLARWGEGPILVLCLARHELLERRPTWGGGIPNAATIVLEPLGAGEVEQLVDALLAGGMPGDLRRRVVDLADGNPLFAEELVRMFVDRGVLRFTDGRWQLAQPVEDVEIPGSVQAVLAARLDALPAAEKRVAQDAAVVGRIFWDALIAHLSRQGTNATGDLLRRLRVKELVVPRQPSTLAGAAEFGFRHVLIRDVAYDSLPKRERAAKHLDVARWAETALADREDELVELLAAHHLAALRYDEEFAGPDPERLRELRARTAAYARRAGRRAGAVGSKETAARWFRVAIEQARALDVDGREWGTLVEEWVEAATGFESEPVLRSELERALDRLDALPDPTPADAQLDARLRSHLAYNQYNAGDAEGARAILREGIRRLEAGGPTPGRATLLGRLGWALWRAGPVEEAPDVLRRAIEEARACGADEAERYAIHDLGVALAMLGRIAEAVVPIEQSLVMARAAGDRALLMRCYINLPGIKSTNGAPPREVMPFQEEGAEAARRAMDRASYAWMAMNLSEGHLAMADLPGAVAWVDEGMEAAAAIEYWSQVDAGRWRTVGLRLAAGERTGLRDALEMVIATPSATEPQNWLTIETLFAAIDWPSDPRGAAERLARTMAEAGAMGALPDPALLCGRMAARLGDGDLLAQATVHHRHAIEGTDGPRLQLEHRWLQALALAADAGLPELRSLAQESVALEERRMAAEILTDAAAMAERAGVDGGDDRARGVALLAAGGMAPLLDAR